MAGNILSPEEHRQLTTIPTEIDDAELVRNFTLQPEDLVLINPRLPPIHPIMLLSVLRRAVTRTCDTLCPIFWIRWCSRLRNRKIR